MVSLVGRQPLRVPGMVLWRCRARVTFSPGRPSSIITSIVMISEASPQASRTGAEAILAADLVTGAEAILAVRIFCRGEGTSRDAMVYVNAWNSLYARACVRVWRVCSLHVKTTSWFTGSLL